MATADLTVYVADARPVRDLVEASIALDLAVLNYGLSHELTIREYMQFRLALRQLQVGGEDAAQRRQVQD